MHNAFLRKHLFETITFRNDAERDQRAVEAARIAGSRKNEYYTDENVNQIFLPGRTLDGPGHFTETGNSCKSKNKIHSYECKRSLQTWTCTYKGEQYLHFDKGTGHLYL